MCMWCRHYHTLELPCYLLSSKLNLLWFTKQKRCHIFYRRKRKFLTHPKTISSISLLVRQGLHGQNGKKFGITAFRTFRFSQKCYFKTVDKLWTCQLLIIISICTYTKILYSLRNTITPSFCCFWKLCIKSTMNQNLTVVLKHWMTWLSFHNPFVCFYLIQLSSGRNQKSWRKSTTFSRILPLWS